MPRYYKSHEGEAMTNPSPASGSGLTFLGKLFSVLLILGLVGLGAWVMLRHSAKGGGVGGQPAAAAKFDTTGIVETQTSVPALDRAAAYVPKDNIIDIELSEYAGYGGLIAANGGLEPNDESYF